MPGKWPSKNRRPEPGLPHVHLTGEMDTGAFSVIEFSATSQTPPHEGFSHTEERFFCLLEGEWEVRVGEDRFRARAGGSFHALAGVPYSYRVVTPFGRAVVLVTEAASRARA